jgi:methionyl aminopeptidase
MINAGVRDAVIDASNEWIARTRDGKASAQWEHTLLITESGYEILTPWERLHASLLLVSWLFRKL